MNLLATKKIRDLIRQWAIALNDELEYGSDEENKIVRIPEKPCSLIGCRYNLSPESLSCLCPIEQYDACAEDSYSGFQGGEANHE